MHVINGHRERAATEFSGLSMQAIDSSGPIRDIRHLGVAIAWRVLLR